MTAMGIASKYQSVLRSTIESIDDEVEGVTVHTAIALATFRLFVDTDTKRIIPEEDIFRVAEEAILSRLSEV